MLHTIDKPGTVCALGTSCTTQMIGHGGFDEHHEWPISLGGSNQGPLLTLCPNHHRRQHSLIRYLVQVVGIQGMPEDREVTKHFTPTERSLARSAVQKWVDAGAPTIVEWPCPAARV